MRHPHRQVPAQSRRLMQTPPPISTRPPPLVGGIQTDDPCLPQLLLAIERGPRFTMDSFCTCLLCSALKPPLPVAFSVLAFLRMLSISPFAFWMLSSRRAADPANTLWL